MAIEDSEIDYSDAKDLLLDLINNSEINHKKALNRKIIFWYDGQKKYTSVIDKIKQEINNENNEIIIYQKNSFWIRYHIEIEEPNKNFVIYFDTNRPLDQENDLLDLETSSGYELSFNPDNTTKIIVELGLTDSNRSIIEENEKFFANQDRRKKFKEFECEKNNSTINYIITAILLGIKSVNADDLMKNIIKIYLSDETKFNKLKSFGNDKFVFNLFNKSFGTNIKDYSELSTLLKELVLTYLLQDLSDKELISNKYGNFILKQKDTAQVFTNKLMTDSKMSKYYEKISNQVFEEFGLDDIFTLDNLEKYINSDAFKIIDKNIILFIINQLNSNIYNYDEYRKLILSRQPKFWYLKFEKEYKLLLHILDYFKDCDIGVKKIKNSEIEDLVKLYDSDLYKIDYDYRKVIYYYNLLKDTDEFKDLIEKVENQYINKYMSKLSEEWDKALERLPKYNSTKLVMQNKFYNKFIKPDVSETRNGRVIVIISDAFRYEFAKELNYKLSQIAKNTSVNYMLGLVPSYTKLGKAALLPNKTISMIDGSDDILVDGKKTSSTSDREKILQNENEDSIVIQYDTLVNDYKKADWKKLFSGKKIVYIYHDEVDIAGENTPDEVFEAGQRSIEHLYNLVDSLNKTFSGVNVYITADHGFFYRKGKVQGANKITKMAGATKQKTRYTYTPEDINNEATISFNLDYIFNNSHGQYVNILKGYDIFSKPGEPDKYFHGGDLPQELIIPLIDFKSARGIQGSKSVGLVYTGLQSKITNTITYLDFAQNVPVDENNTECTYKIHFEDDSKNVISNEVKIVANRVDKEIKDRYFKEKFIFKSMEYPVDKNYYLIILKEGKGSDGDIEVQRLKFDIDITIMNNFDF